MTQEMPDGAVPLAARQKLDGWKSIASYLNRTVRTVQRWEKLEGLPVHRLEHTAAASVFAYTEEIDAWWKDRGAGLEPGKASPDLPTGIPAPPAGRTEMGLRPVILGLIGFVAIGAAATYYYFRPLVRFASAAVSMPVNQGNVEMAVISPDGKRLVYAWDVNHQHMLAVRDLTTSEEKILIQGVFSRYYGLTFTRDNESLYFTAQSGQGSSLYRLPVAGGAPVRILDGIDSPVSFSPGDRQMAFVRGGGESQLVVANPDGTAQRTLLSRKLPEYLDYPAWSPDGNVIIASSISREGRRLIAVDPDRGNEQPIGNQVWNFLRFPVWLDHKTLAVSLRVSPKSQERLYSVSYPEGKTDVLSLPGDRFLTLSASLDGHTLAGVMRNVTSSIWTAEPSGELREIVAPVSGTRGIAWSGDGRLLLGARGISSVKPDGTGLIRLLDGEGFGAFAVCGGRVVHVRSEGANVGLWQAAQGGTSKLLVANFNEAAPQCSPGGEWVVYADRWSPAYQIPVSGGVPQVLIAEPVLSPVVSSDNRWIAAYRSKRESPGQGPREIAIFPRGGGAAAKTLPIPPAEFEWTPLLWSPDNQAIGYVETQGTLANLWLQPVDGGPRRQLTHFQSGRVTDFDWSPSGQLAVELGSVARDVFLVRDRQ